MSNIDKLCRLIDLEDGTFFYVKNGYWIGYIGSENGKKMCYVGTKLVNPTENHKFKFVLSEDYRADIEILDSNFTYYDFDAELAYNELVSWIKEWFDGYTENATAVLEVSNDIRSIVVLSACVKALGKDRVLGICFSNGNVLSATSCISKFRDSLGAKIKHFNIRDSVMSTFKGLQRCDIHLTDQTKKDVESIERSKVLRAICSSVRGILVDSIDLSNHYIGNFTKYGENCGDIEPLIDFTMTEIIEIAHYLGLSDFMVDKLCKDSDKDLLGFTYHDLDMYIRLDDNYTAESTAKIIDNMRHRPIFNRENPHHFRVRSRYFI